MWNRAWNGNLGPCFSGVGVVFEFGMEVELLDFLNVSSNVHAPDQTLKGWVFHLVNKAGSIVFFNVFHSLVSVPEYCGSLEMF